MFTTLSVTTASVPVTACPPLPPGPAADLSAPLCVLVSSAVVLPDTEPAVTPLDIAHHFANVPDPRHWAFRLAGLCVAVSPGSLVHSA